jgi:arabinose-5-phosphate isomerase
MILETAKRVLEIEADAVRRMIDVLGEEFENSARLLADCGGRIVTTGMGKSGIVCRKLAATLSSTGTPSLFMHPAEAMHGDLGMIARGDTVLMISNSGETSELLKLLTTIKRLGTPLISMLGNTESTLATHSDFVLDIGVDREACPLGLAPTASSTAALALGDALAMAVSVYKGFKPEEFARLHPGGKLGKNLALVGELMHTGDQLPLVFPDTVMTEVIYEMSRKGMGIAVVVSPPGEDGERMLLGVISDGDLRRLLQEEKEGVLDLSAEACMTPDPQVISPDEMAAKALNLMEKRKITSLMVTGLQGELKGLIHLHDLWETELF